MRRKDGRRLIVVSLMIIGVAAAAWWFDRAERGPLLRAISRGDHSEVRRQIAKSRAAELGGRFAWPPYPSVSSVLSPVGVAVWHGEYSIATLLVESGFDLGPACNGCPSPLFVVVRGFSTDSAGASDLLRAMVQHGADINAWEPSSGLPALALVLEPGANPSLVRLLFSLGADSDATCRDGTTVRQIAQRQGVEYLLEARQDGPAK